MCLAAPTVSVIMLEEVKRQYNCIFTINNAIILEPVHCDHCKRYISEQNVLLRAFLSLFSSDCLALAREVCFSCVYLGPCLFEEVGSPGCLVP